MFECRVPRFTIVSGSCEVVRFEQLCKPFLLMALLLDYSRGGKCARMEQTELGSFLQRPVAT